MEFINAIVIMMKESFLNSQPIMFTSILLFFTEAIAIFDVRIQQAKKNGTLPPDYRELPQWTRVFFILRWVFRGILLILNWQYAIGFHILLFILKVLPVLEVIGNILMAPFKPQGQRYDI